MEPDEELGFAAPRSFVHSWNDEGLPVLVVEIGFHFLKGTVEPLSAENWEKYQSNFSLPLAGDTAAFVGVPLPGWIAESGPYLVVRRIEEPAIGYFDIDVPPKWLASVRDCSELGLVITTGVYLSQDQQLIGWNGRCSGGRVRLGGHFEAPFLTDLSRYKLVMPDPSQPFVNLHHHCFLLDADVIIDIERSFARSSPPHMRDVRALLLNLAYQDVLPGPSLQQLRRPKHRHVDDGPADRAYRALSILGWTRGQMEEIFTDGEPPQADADRGLSWGAAEDEAIAALLFMYAGLLKMRLLWSPADTLVNRVDKFLQYCAWLASDLEFSGGYLIQSAFNLWVGDEAAGRQASRLLKFRARDAGAHQVDAIWGAASDLFLLHVQDRIPRQHDDLRIPIVITADAALAELRTFIAPVGVTELESAEGTFQLGMSGLRLALHPNLQARAWTVMEAVGEVQQSAKERANKGIYYPARVDEVLVMISVLEEQLRTAIDGT